MDRTIKFNFGKIYMTNGIDNLAQENEKFCEFVEKSLARHLTGDWGDLPEEDKALNNSALANGDDRIFSSYNFNGGSKIWIITEWDRSATTILFPDEY